MACFPDITCVKALKCGLHQRFQAIQHLQIVLFEFDVGAIIFAFRRGNGYFDNASFYKRLLRHRVQKQWEFGMVQAEALHTFF